MPLFPRKGIQILLERILIDRPHSTLLVKKKYTHLVKKGELVVFASVLILLFYAISTESRVMEIIPLRNHVCALLNLCEFVSFSLSSACCYSKKNCFLLFQVKHCLTAMLNKCTTFRLYSVLFLCSFIVYWMFSSQNYEVLHLGSDEVIPFDIWYLAFESFGILTSDHLQYILLSMIASLAEVILTAIMIIIHRYFVCLNVNFCILLTIIASD